MADAVKLTAENTAHLGGSYPAVRWADALRNAADTRTADEIAVDVFRRAGLRLEGGGKP